MTMICSKCNRFGIHWIGPYGNLTGTKCPHCGGENCQEDVQPVDQCSECGSEVCNGECYGDDMMGASG
jgi:uncharacterized protein (DUF983 family)